MIVIGADTRKRSHTLCAVDAETGRPVASREIAANEDGQLAALRWAEGLDCERVWTIEDCRHVSLRLEQALVTAGERVIRVPPFRMGDTRRAERERGKSDQIDALAVARAVVKDGVESFPTAFLDEDSMDIRLLAGHRTDLVAERTRAQNRLRWHLIALCPELEHQIAPGTLGQYNELITESHPQLLDEPGCRTLTAAILIGHTAGAERFRSEASFARHAGTAPIRCSSGQRDQHRLDRGGDRQLNHALHMIALSRLQHDPVTKAYLERKRSEGKTRK
jgi:transposase